ncbi:MAG: hypothetical protein AAB403_03030 [Planctomycetota bacterium]
MMIALGACGKTPGTGVGNDQAGSAGGTSSVPAEASLSRLSVDNALGWRATYGDLLGKPREAVIERFGSAAEDETNNGLSWDPSPKTHDRHVTVGFNSKDKGSGAAVVKVFARPTESLDPMEVLRKAPMFKFETGTYKDSLVNYFTAETKDGRNIFQFDVAETGVKFRAMLFSQK